MLPVCSMHVLHHRLQALLLEQQQGFQTNRKHVLLPCTSCITCVLGEGKTQDQSCT